MISLATLYILSRCSPDERKKLFKIGRKKFNNNPKDGIAYLIERRLVEGSPEGVADYLLACKELRKKAIGDYLASNHEFNKQVLDVYMGKHNFAGLSLIAAMRQLFSHFMCPGESQQIDRLTDVFAKYYCKQNPLAFRTTSKYIYFKFFKL